MVAKANHWSTLAKVLRFNQYYLILLNLPTKPLWYSCPVSRLNEKWNRGFLYRFCEVSQLPDRNLLQSRSS